jgi:uncharacterized membrane protein YfcA/uncharacterized membrane protein
VSGAAAAYVREGFSNVRIAMLLEIATTLGAVSGAALATHISTSGLAVAFGGVLVYSAYLPGRAAGARPDGTPDRLATALQLDSTYPTQKGRVQYHVRRVPVGFTLMYVAGILSGLLGIGSGAVKVLAMDRVMQLPFKITTTTSSFMIGVTAAASAASISGEAMSTRILRCPLCLACSLGQSGSASAEHRPDRAPAPVLQVGHRRARAGDALRGTDGDAVTANQHPSTRTGASFARLLGIVLRVGVLLSAAVVFCGGVIYLLSHGGASPDFALFRGEPADLRSVGGIINDARHGSGRGVIQLGVLLLIATPVARVLFAVGGFIKAAQLALYNDCGRGLDSADGCADQRLKRSHAEPPGEDSADRCRRSFHRTLGR